jgi:hydrogenase maturation protease
MSNIFGSDDVSVARSGIGLDVAIPPNVVVGLGNEIAGDDGVGVEVARSLSATLRRRTDVEVIALPWGGFSLLDVLAGRSRAWIVDCLTTGRHPPGTIVRLSESDFAGSVRLNSFHDIGFGTVMELGRSLGWSMPQDVDIYAIEGSRVDEFTQGLSPEVAEAANRVMDEIARSIGVVQ